MKISLTILLFFNLILLGIYYFDIENKFFTQLNEGAFQKMKENNENIKKTQQYSSILKEVDNNVYLYYKEIADNKKAQKLCKTNIRDVSGIINQNNAISFNYLDYRLPKYKNIINCNIYKAYGISSIYIKVPFNLIKTPIFKEDIINGFYKSNYKVNYFITLRKGDLIKSYKYNIFRKIDKNKVSSITFYVDDDLSDVEIKLLKGLFSFYYENYNVKFNVGSKDKKYNGTNIKYLSQYTEKLSLDIKEQLDSPLIQQSLYYLNYKLEDTKRINLLNINELIKKTKTKLIIPNSFYFLEDSPIVKEKEFQRIKEKSLENIKKVDFKLINLKYKDYFEQKIIKDIEEERK